MSRLALTAAAACAFLALAAACSSGSGSPFDIAISPSPDATASPTSAPTAAPTPTAEPTLAPESDGIDGFRAFATLIDGAVNNGNGLLFSDRAIQSEITCAGDEELGPCVDQPADTVISGVWQGVWRSDAGGLVPADVIASRFESLTSSALANQADAFGNGEAQLYALATSQSGVFSGESAFYAIVTAIVQGPERRIIAYQFTYRNGAWALAGALEAGVLFDEWLTGNCADCYDAWERWEGAP